MNAISNAATWLMSTNTPSLQMQDQQSDRKDAAHHWPHQAVLRAKKNAPSGYDCPAQMVASFGNWPTASVNTAPPGLMHRQLHYAKRVLTALRLT